MLGAIETGRILMAAALMAGAGVVLGAVIGAIARIFRVEGDSRVDLVTELLPGANCGGCGKAGCRDFAKSVVSGENPPGKCPVSTREQVGAIALALGVEVGEVAHKKAVVRCSGTLFTSDRVAYYNGIHKCSSAMLVGGGPKVCRYGCLGMGDCARKCPFGAIEIINNLAVVHEELCVGCGSCAAVCPRGVIAIVPAAAHVHVFCNSPEKGAQKRKVCRSACLGCGKCVRKDPEKFELEAGLARVKYSAPELPTAETVEAVGCPTGALAMTERHRQKASEETNAK
jgi:RnfABCDGE-type electron transport complex B subunit